MKWNVLGAGVGARQDDASRQLRALFLSSYLVAAVALATATPPAIGATFPRDAAAHLDGSLIEHARLSLEPPMEAVSLTAQELPTSYIPDDAGASIRLTLSDLAGGASYLSEFDSSSSNLNAAPSAAGNLPSSVSENVATRGEFILRPDSMASVAFPGGSSEFSPMLMALLSSATFDPTQFGPVAPVPEPSTAIFGMALVGFSALARYSVRAKA